MAQPGANKHLSTIREAEREPEFTGADSILLTASRSCTSARRDRVRSPSCGDSLTDRP